VIVSDQPSGRPFPARLANSAALAKVVHLICVQATAGRGVEGDPVRGVTCLYTYDGTLIATFDAFADPEGWASGAMQGLLRSP
jgi:hypothetical protein